MPKAWNKNGGLNMPEEYIGLETDEMYTQYNDIVNELDHYPAELFKGKKILFPCDWDAVYNCGDKIQFETHNKINHIIDIQAGADIPKCNFVRYFWETYARYPENKIELFASGYNPKIADPNRLSCMDVDYSKFDWVITNPPFSFVTDFLKILTDESQRRKNTNRPFHFLVMIPWQTLGNKCAEQLISKKVFPGYGKDLHLTFLDIKKKPIIGKTGKPTIVCIYWITDLDMNFPTVDNNYFVPQHSIKENIHTYFDERLYLETAPKDSQGHSCACDGLPILVHRDFKNLYYDYSGYQSVPITCIDYYNPRVFDICASTHILNPCKSIGNFKYIPSQIMLGQLIPGLKQINGFLVKVRPEILSATKGKKSSEVFDACEEIIGIRRNIQ
jgi:hypothetical protein